MPTIRGFDFPDDLYYMVEHDMWARRDGDGMATVGITPLGAHISGEFIEFMPKPLHTAVERERALGLLEMSKVIRSIRAPVGGVIVDINERVKAEPGLINREPYGAGWLVRLQPSAWEEDARTLVTGDRIPTAIAAYMSLLTEQFGEGPG
jgi:glycine cleavage system H protein